jgi:CelD/BcsL family acetyltransferase involved in cellulose biosynthesis
MAKETDIRAEIINQFSGLEFLSGDWDRLWQVSPVREVFTQLPWNRSSWSTYGNCGPVCTPVIYRENEVIGILPLINNGRILRFIGTPRSDYNDILCAETEALSVLETALSALMEVKSTWDYCCFENLPENSNLVKFHSRLNPRLQKRFKMIIQAPCPTLLLPVDEKEQILASLMKKKSLKRHKNKLEKAGRLRFYHIEEREKIKKHLPLFFKQHMERRGKAGDRSLFYTEVAQNFYLQLIDELDPRRELRFAVLELDNRPVAYHFGFETGNKFIWYKPSFDVEFWKYSPGEVIIWNLLDYISQKNITEFDFTVGNEDFKTRFTNFVRSNHALYFFSTGVKAEIKKNIFQIKQQVKKKLS